MYNGSTLLYAQEEHDIVNELCFNKKKIKSNRMCDLQYFLKGNQDLFCRNIVHQITLTEKRGSITGETAGIPQSSPPSSLSSTSHLHALLPVEKNTAVPFPQGTW